MKESHPKESHPLVEVPPGYEVISPITWQIVIKPFEDDETGIIRMLLEAVKIGFMRLDPTSRARVWEYVNKRVDHEYPTSSAKVES